LFLNITTPILFNRWVYKTRK